MFALNADEQAHVVVWQHTKSFGKKAIRVVPTNQDFPRAIALDVDVAEILVHILGISQDALDSLRPVLGQAEQLGVYLWTF